MLAILVRTLHVELKTMLENDAGMYSRCAAIMIAFVFKASHAMKSGRLEYVTTVISAKLAATSAKPVIKPPNCASSEIGTACAAKGVIRIGNADGM
jgi:hypothetical protein